MTTEQAEAARRLEDRDVVVRVDNRLRIRGDLPPEVAAELKALFAHPNPEVAAKRAIGISTYGLPTRLVTWREEGGELTLPRGGMRRLREVLRAAGVEYAVEDRRVEGAPCRFPPYVGHPLRDYQLEAVEAALAREQCLLRAPTGAGKTCVAFALLARVGLNALVILPTGGLFKQWIDRAATELGVRGDDLGVVQGKTRRLRPLTIAMQQTLARGVHPDVRAFFGVVLVDESQLASANTHAAVIDAMPARYRFAVSADERRKDRKECVVYDVVGEVAHEVTRAAVEASGSIVDVEIRAVPTDFRADWYGMPDEDAPADERKELDFNRLLDEMTADKGRDALLMRFAREELGAGEQVIVLTARRDHAHDLHVGLACDGVASGFLLGDKEPGDDVEFDRTRAGLLDGKVRVGVGTYKALGFGIDLPAVAAGFAMTPVAGNDQQFNQVRGRLCRPSPGKARGRLYVAWDQHVYPGHLARILARNRSVVVWNGHRWIDGRAWRRLRRAG